MKKENTEKNRFRILLAFPPQWTPQAPHFGMTSLAGNLRNAGHEVIVRDLNVEYYDYVLTPEYLEYAKNKIMMNYHFLVNQAKLKTLVNDNSLDFRIEAGRLLAMEDFFKENQPLIEKFPRIILDCKETLRDPRRFYNPSLLIEAFYVIDKALEFISLPFHPAKIALNNFDQPHCLLVTADLLNHAENKSGNLFYDFMDTKSDELSALNPDMIGISINSFSQVLPGLTLARFLRKKAPARVTINIGGNFFMRVREALKNRPEFFRYFCHCLSMGEGEKQSIILAEELKNHRGLAEVPDILYLEESGNGAVVKETRHAEPSRLNDLAPQSFEGFPMDLYFSPRIVACIESSKGCYWGKCTFCDTDFGIKRDVKDPDKLIAEIKYLRDNFGIRDFEFIDESIHPEYMKKMAERFIEEDLQIHWFSNGRLEEAFRDGEFLNLLRKSGQTMILWGFESGAPRILDLINKGIDYNNRYEILEKASEAGIWNFAYIFFGFPTETCEEAMETINAIAGHHQIIDSYGRSVFTLGKHCLLFLDAEKYGILDVIEDSEELSSNLSYKVSKGMKDEEIDSMMKECTRICAEAYEYSLWYFLRNRENIHLYMVKYGREYVKNFKVRQFFDSKLNVW